MKRTTAILAIGAFAVAGSALAQTKPDPKVQQCRATNQAAWKDVNELYAKAKAAGRIDPKEAQAFQAMGARLNAHAKALAADGFSMADCERMAREIAADKAAVQRMAAAPAAPAGPDPKVAQCRATNQAAWKDVNDLYQKAKAAGKIDPKEAQAFQAMGPRLSAHQQFLAKDGYSLADCERIGREIAADKIAVQRMAK